MKKNRRTVWILLFLSCFLFWFVIFSFLNHALAVDEYQKNNDDHGDASPEELIEKVKQLDLTEQQRKFIESFINIGKINDKNE